MNYDMQFGPGDKLMSPGELLALLKTKTSFSFHYFHLPTDYFASLTYSLPDHYVRIQERECTIHISPSISTEKILPHKAAVLECARSFRREANGLMQLMAETFGVDLQTLDGLHELRFAEGYRLHLRQLNEVWQFHLHGAECRFENIETGQVLEVIIITFPEFGYLNSYFFELYMSTTERFKPLAAFFNESKAPIEKALELLILDGSLQSKTVDYGSRRIIAV